MTVRTSTVVVYTITEAARRIGLTRWTLARDIEAGRLTAHRSGRSHGPVLIFADDLLDYVLQHRGGKGIPTT